MRSPRLLIILCLLILAGITITFGQLTADLLTHIQTPALPVYRAEVIHAYPHDPDAFTEGLVYDRGSLDESTGPRGNSTLRRVNLTTGEVTRIQHMPSSDFGEGVTIFGTTVAQETEDSGIGTLYDRDTLEKEGTFNYSTEGWGITWDGSSLIMSDGTPTLHVLDPKTFRQVRSLNVTAQGIPVSNLNELEYVNGEIYANVWPTDRIARISPETGEVTGWIDLSGLLSADDRKRIGWSSIEYLRGQTSIPFEQEACLNGIAYDPDNNRLFVTGKLWPELFEIQLVPA
jgi:glutamine cyclotransferase